MREPRLIDSYALEDKVFESKKSNPHTDWIVRKTHDHEHESFLRKIALAPTIDAVPVVRCKDCKHITPVEGGLPLCALHNIACAYNDFCSYGERKDGDT